MKKQKAKKEEVIVLSVGGSLIVPGDIDTMFLSTFKDLILKGVRSGKRFVIITGGGGVARTYQAAVRLVAGGNDTDADWVGIDATRINARLVKASLKPHAEDHIIQSPLEKFSFKKSVIVGGGWKPGFSSDYDAVLLAKRFKAKKMVNLSNIDYVYTSDPRINAAAEKIEKISWKEFRKLLPKKWTPGLSSPFDPIASKEAEKLKLQVAVINGKKLHELDKFIAGESFIGTLIS
ncbi:MAG: UMP kinase [Candidatus Paceibacterota bacterium]|jgi:uridylate kinase